MKVAIHNLIFEIPNKNEKFFARSSGLTKEVIEERIDMWVWPEHRERLSFFDLSEEDQKMLREIISETLTEEDCQEYVDKFDGIKDNYIKDNYINEDYFADSVMEFDSVFMDKILNRSSKFHAFKLLHL